MTYINTGIPSTPPSNGTSTGAPAGSGGDGVNWPYNPNGQTPDFSINWNSVPPPTAQQIEAIYEKLINWLKDNTGSPAFYNGAIMLLQMTTEIGQHMGDYKGTNLGQFIANQISTPGGETFLQMIIDVAAQGAAVSQSSLSGGTAAANAFLDNLIQTLQGLSGLGVPFNQMLDEATKDKGTIDSWITSHWKTYTDPSTGKSYSGWVNDNGNPMTMDDFTQYAQFALGMALIPPNTQDPSVNQEIDAMYQAQIQQLVAEFKGNPFALLIALMTLINQRDQDNGVAVNGYGGTLDEIKQANAIIQKMLGDLSGGVPNMADFFKQMNLLQQFVGNNPALNSIWSQLKSEMGTINNMTGSTVSDPGSSWSQYTIKDPGVYNFPPGMIIQLKVNGQWQQYTVPADGHVYISDPNTQVEFNNNLNPSLTFAQMAGMGFYDGIENAFKDKNGNDTSSFSTIIMSNFTNNVTGMQSVLNSPSPAIQQELQNETQTMQAMENFEKQAYQEITNVNQQIMRLVQSVMG